LVSSSSDCADFFRRHGISAPSVLFDDLQDTYYFAKNRAGQFVWGNRLLQEQHSLLAYSLGSFIAQRSLIANAGTCNRSGHMPPDPGRHPLYWTAPRLNGSYNRTNQITLTPDRAYRSVRNR
jgi:hypothetical protein